MKAIYVIHEPGARACKVGIATDPRTRLRALQSNQPVTLELFGAWESDHAISLERLVHSALAAERIRSEWFAVSPIEAVLTIGRVSGENCFLLEPWAPPRKVECVGSSPLRRWREAQNLTTTDLAKRLGVNQSTVWRVEQGERRANVALENALIELTGLTRDELVAPLTVRRPA
jgi:DNA-binding XRE family transcriptional regulator